MTKLIEAKGVPVKYWLCCGNTNPTHDGRCHELLIGNKHHVRYGTKKEHSDWQTSLYTVPPSVDALIAEIDEWGNRLVGARGPDIKEIVDRWRTK